MLTIKLITSSVIDIVLALVTWCIVANENEENVFGAGIWKECT
jgi:hypothetical protein